MAADEKSKTFVMASPLGLDRVVAMKRGVALMLLVAASFALSQSSSTKSLPPVKLSAQDVPAECNQVDGSFPVDIQISMLFERTDIYESVLPPLRDKSSQSFECSGKKGTVYYFIFNDEAGRKRAANFIKPLLWGEKKPSGAHPELILESQATIAVVSFKSQPGPLLKALRDKLGLNAQD